KDNVLFVLNSVIGRSMCSELRSHSLSIICPKPSRFFESKEFLNLDETTLLSLLSRDDLCMEEGELWDHLIKWGLKNTPSIKNHDVSKWSDEEFIALEKTIWRCVPLIRFWQLSTDVFNSKIRPFKRV